MTALDPTELDAEKVAELFDRVADMAPSEAARYLDEVCREDPRLRDEVLALLQFDQGAPRPLPSTVGRFVIAGRLGEGGMGLVLRGRDPTLDRDVAIKLVRTERSGGDARARLLREAQAMARVTHPNVVAVYEVGVHEDDVFIAMELVPGETLGAWLAREPRSPREIVAKFAQAGRGLAAAHRAGVLHRDFKPENVLVGSDGRARVVDFGLARAHAIASEAAPQGALASSLTQAGTIMGTPAYMSPEHFGGTVVEASDQFSFCVALYRALFGEHPFAARNLAEIRRAVTTEEPRVPAPGDVPPAIVAAILRGLARAPEDRWPSMDDLLDVIESVLAVDPGEASITFQKQRVLGTVGLLVFGLVNLLGLGVRTDFRFEVGPRSLALQSGLGLVIIAIVAVVLRRALRASAYNRRIIAFFAIALATPTVHRLLVPADEPIASILRADAIFTAGLSVFAAITIERWLHGSAAVMLAYVVITYVAPLTLVPGYGLSLVLCVALAIWTWRSDPRGLRALSESISKASKDKDKDKASRGQEQAREQGKAPQLRADRTPTTEKATSPVDSFVGSKGRISDVPVDLEKDRYR